MNSGGHWRLEHRPALDGLRGVAVLLVVASHLWRPVITWGTAGVTMFFTLSGFLITALLIQERAAGRVSLVGFYGRRALRLLPALLAVLVVAVLLGAASPGAALSALAYAGNWTQAFEMVDMGALAHTWSLAIEEQFYVFWPVLLVLASRSRHWRAWLITLAAAGCVYAAVVRLVLWDQGFGLLRVYMGSDTRMDAVLVGCLFALWATSRRRVRGPSPRVTDALTALVVVAIVVPGSTAVDYLVLPLWLPVATCILIAGGMSDRYAGVMTSRWLLWVGRRSYGLYLWHGFAVLFVSPRLDVLPELAASVVVFTGSLVATGLSWRYLEQPFLRMKHAVPRGVPAGRSLHDRDQAAMPAA